MFIWSIFCAAIPPAWSGKSWRRRAIPPMKPGCCLCMPTPQPTTDEFAKHALVQARAWSWRLEAGPQETAAAWQLFAALREAELGNSTYASKEVAATLGSSPAGEVRAFAALALARAGDSLQASTLVEQLVKNDQRNQFVKLYWLPAIRGAIQLNKGDSSRALADLEALVPYDFAQGTNGYSLYLRGQGYLLAHNGTAAAAEFQKMIDHPAS